MEAAKEIEILTAERELYASAMDRMKAALAQQGEPVAWIDPIVGTIRHDYERFDKSGHQPLYTAPQAQQPLTDEQIKAGRIEGYDAEDAPDAWDFEQGVRFAERHHGIG